MTREVVERIVVYNVCTGVPERGSCSYDNCADYAEWDDAVRDIKAALDAGLHVMIERELVIPEEFEARPEFPADYNPLLPHTERT